MTTDKPDTANPAPQGNDALGNTVPPQTCTTLETDGPGEEDGPWAKGWADRIGNDPLFEGVLAAEQRRQTVQAEAMVNLAVGIVITKILGLRHITITPQDLVDFQRQYVAEQVQNKDGSFTILVTGK